MKNMFVDRTRCAGAFLFYQSKLLRHFVLVVTVSPNIKYLMEKRSVYDKIKIG